jgi:hypothetical protein
MPDGVSEKRGRLGHGPGTLCMIEFVVWVHCCDICGQTCARVRRSAHFALAPETSFYLWRLMLYTPQLAAQLGDSDQQGKEKTN